MFPDFALERIGVGDAELRVRYGGSGSPLLLLHGHPRTHASWHRVAPLLARDHTVVCPDLRGYGESSKPVTTPDHEPYSKRSMARDCVALMRALGHERFAVAGHDRGCYVAFRLAIDHPEVATQLVVMDGVPIFSMFPLGLPATELRGFSGVLNSTTNVVLTEIEKGRSFEEGVRRAQAMGVAETDPSADLDGWDAAVKVAALAIVLMNVPLRLDQVRRTGIRDLSEEKIRSVRASGMRYKLVCRAERRADSVVVSTPSCE